MQLVFEELKRPFVLGFQCAHLCLILHDRRDELNLFERVAGHHLNVPLLCHAISYCRLGMLSCGKSMRVGKQPIGINKLAMRCVA
jgi:hypothetical protein